jgi:hypothetical protein
VRVIGGHGNMLAAYSCAQDLSPRAYLITGV